MIINYQGVDISGDVSVIRCMHDMYAAEQSDLLTVVFNDARRLWDVWGAKKGDCIQLQEDKANTGKMYITGIRPEDGRFTVLAQSCPESLYVSNTRVWEKVTLPQIAQDIAGAHGLQLYAPGTASYRYDYILQNNQSDIEFLSMRLMLEGYACLIYNGMLVVYDEADAETSAPEFTLKLSAADSFYFSDGAGQFFSRAEPRFGNFFGSFSAPNTPPGGVFSGAPDTQAGSGSEANRFARGILRGVNKQVKRGVISGVFRPLLAAGSVIRIEQDAARSWNGPVFLTHVRHDYVKQKTKIFFRPPLEGY